MNGKFKFLLMITSLVFPGRMAGENGSLFSAEPARAFLSAADCLDRAGRYSGEVKYSVALPMADDDVVYNIRLSSADCPSDTLLGFSYLIDWQLPVNEGADTVAGFTDYYPGHLYIYRDRRLREYHHDWDSIPFGGKSGGVQRSGQFVDLFPRIIAARLREMASDSTYTLSVARGNVEGAPALLLKARRILNGQECLQSEYSLDPSTLMPLRISSLFNPGMLGEQEVTALYGASSLPAPPAAEEEIIALYPTIFDRYRTSNYSVETLRGEPMPGFALPTLTGERYMRNKGDRFPNPTVVALLDPDVDTTAETVALLRRALDRLPSQTDLIFAFKSSDIDTVEALTGRLRPGEICLLSAAPLVRSTGANAFPAILLCDADGTVSSVILGFSSTLADNLTSSAALLKP